MLGILIWILIIEFGLVGSFVLIALGENLYLSAKINKANRAIKSVSQILIECFTRNTSSLELFPKKIENPEYLLSALESFSLRFQGGRTLRIKEELSNQFLLPPARKKTNSRTWYGRHYAARCFALHPLEQDLSYMLSLLRDPVFLVNSLAAASIVQLESQEGIVFMIEKISTEKNTYLKCFYNDLLRQGSSKVFQCIEKEALKKSDEKTHLTCLSILASKVCPVNEALLQRDISSSSSEIRDAALKVYARNPQKKSEEVLLHAIESPSSENRLEAAYGLAHFSSEASLLALKKALSDVCVPIRVQAAQSLKKIGPRGVAILNQQSKRKDPLTFEIAKYVQEFS